MAFQIGFYDQPDVYEYDNPAIAAARGALILGESVEGFLANLYVWTREQYQSQWKDALTKLVSGSDRAMLIVEFNSLESSHLVCWNVYRDRDSVHFQEQLLFFNRLTRPFVVEQASNFVSDRITHTEDGVAISDWTVSIRDIEAQVRAWGPAAEGSF